MHIWTTIINFLYLPAEPKKKSTSFEDGYVSVDLNQSDYVRYLEETNQQLQQQLDEKKNWKWRASKWAFFSFLDYLPGLASMVMVHPAVYHASNLYSLFSGALRLMWSFGRR